MEVNTIISVVSLIIAIISLIISIRLHIKQSKVYDFQIEKYELERLEKEKSDLNVQVCRPGKNHALRVWNAGGTTVRDINVKIVTEGAPTLFDRDYLPYEYLEPGKNFDLALLSYDNCVGKFNVRLTWLDDKGENHTKDVLCNY